MAPSKGKVGWREDGELGLMGKAAGAKRALSGTACTLAARHPARSVELVGSGPLVEPYAHRTGAYSGLIPNHAAAVAEATAMKRILIVEDQPDIRELVRMTLEMEDFEVHEAENGDIGLQMAARLLPDLMLLDVMMPGSVDGLGVCQRIKADAAGKRTKVVMLSARNQEADRQAGRKAGADAYLGKPFSPRQLLDVIGRVL
jgi:CheY-like chemotaxis protein